MYDHLPLRSLHAYVRPPSQLVVDAVIVVAIAAVVFGLSASAGLGGTLPQPVTDQTLVLLGAAAAAAAAIGAAISAHLLDDPRPRWIAAALGLYAVVVLPSTASSPAGMLATASEAPRLVGYIVMIGLLLCTIRPPALLGARATWAAAVLGVVAAFVALFVPPITPGVIRSAVFTMIVLAGWTAVAAAVVVDGYRRGSTPRRRIGLGLVVLAAAQLYRTVGAPPPTVFGALRLLGLVVVVVGFAQLVIRTLGRISDERFAHQEELTHAAMFMVRATEAAAERDHELRNGLAGLAGITHLLSTGADRADQQCLRHAVLAELSRLHRLLDGQVIDAPADDYAVAPVVEGLVALRRPAGVDISVRLQPRLRAVGSSAVLAQVITNLLANCERHAPGAPVAIHAYADGDDAVIEVRDAGPGLPAGATGAAMLDRGVRDESAGGFGLGLAISRTLVEAEGGVLTLTDITAVDPAAGPGCVATVRVPLHVESPAARTPGW